MASVTRGGLGLGRIFQRKTVAQIQSELEHGELKRTLGALNLVLLGIGCIIGTGIFVLTGQAAAQWAGPAIMVSFVITGVLCALVALCYAELASALPVSGSAYSYTYASMGEIAAWVMGVLLLLEYGLAASVVAVGWSGYFVSLLHDLHIIIPPALTAAPGQAAVGAGGAMLAGVGIVNLPAICAIAAVTALLVVGVSESATVNNVIVFIKLAVVIAFIGIGAFYVHPHLWSPLVPPQVPAPPPGTPMDMGHQIWRAITDVLSTKTTPSHYGLGGVIHGAAVIFFAKDRLPAMRSFSCGLGLWIEICTWSSPASLSARARSRVNSVPAVISDEYRSASRATAHSSTRSRRSIGSPPVSASWSTPRRCASPKARIQCSVSSSERYRPPPMSTGLEQYGQCNGHW